MNDNQNFMFHMMMMNNLMNQMVQNNCMNNNGMMNYPTMANMNNMNNMTYLDMNANNNNLNCYTLNNQNNNINRNQNFNMNNMNMMNKNPNYSMSNMNSNLDNSMNNMNSNLDNSMNNMNSNLENTMNNMNSNLDNSMNNMNSNLDNSMDNLPINNMNTNENSLIENMKELNLNNQNAPIYQEIPNYQVSAETKLILENNQIQRGKLVANRKTVSPTLQCAICMDLVMTPVECETCSKLYCKDCIDNWLKNSNECPNKHPFAKKKELDDWIKKELGTIFLKCPYIGCGSDYAYQYWTGHVKKCLLKSRGIIKINNNNTEDTAEGGDEPFVWEKVQFFVKDIHNRTHTFMLPLSTTVRELKEKLEEKTGLKVEAQRLTCNGKAMENTKMLEFYGLQKDQTIYQLGRLKGGNKNKIM